MSNKFLFFAAFFVLCLCGCGNGIKISGTVTYEEDGLPVERGFINFSGATGSFSGIIKNGKYVTGGEKAVQGIPAGQYKVWFSGVQKGEHIIDTKTGIPESSIIMPLIADEFCAENKTPISFEVKPDGQKTFDVQVKKYEPRGKKP
ncbi:MAG: hypothetical protein LBG58_15275 [Planctomycetaceae bacterium]|jgi:hypothetical protein|nr:hypothetical protein [Planctomycetaceae bacterium]